jgi:hypothetical protein
MAFYTFAVFCIPFNGKNSPPFSDRKMKPFSTIALIHAKFLFILLVFMLFASYIGPLLPNWITDELFGVHRVPQSFAEVFGLLLFIALMLIERIFLFLQSDAHDSNTKDEGN